MRFTQARKLRRDDEVTVKETGAVETVMCLQVDDDVIIFSCEGSDYHHTQVK